MKSSTTGIISFVVGAAISAGVMAASQTAGSADRAEVERIVEAYIRNNPEVIVESVQNWQEGAQNRQSESAKAEIVKSHKEIFEAKHDGYTGPADADVKVVEFFDYNCPACRMMFKGLDELAHKDKNVRIIFKELPIFGEQSNENSRVGIAVAALAPEKYLEFHEKMMQVEGRITPAQAIGFATSLGIKEETLKDEMQKTYVNEKLNDNHELAEKLGINGTPALIIGDTIIPSAINYDALKKQVDAARAQK